MVSSTLGTLPFTDIKRHLFDNMPTRVASFGTRKPSVNFDKSSSVPTTLVIQLSNQFTPPTIGNSKSEFVVFNHILNSQRLNGNHLIFAYQTSRQFMQEIFSRIRYFKVNFSNLNSRLFSVFRTFLLCLRARFFCAFFKRF